MSKKVTMQHIAEFLGVSKYVISKALSAQDGVSASTRERVIQAATQLGYFAQKNAYLHKAGKANKPEPEAESVRATQAQPKQSVLVLMPNIRFQTRESSYWGKILDGISTELEQRGLGMVIVTETNANRFHDVLNPRGFLGVIGIGLISTSFILEIHRTGMPMVLVDHEEPLIPADTIFVNNVDSMTRLTNHLIGIGHQRLQFVGNIRYSRSFYDRWHGFRSALEENGLPYDTAEAVLALQSADNAQTKEELKGWLLDNKQAGKLPTALVCANDAIAVCALEALQELGCGVPDEVAVTGFDNIEDSLRCSPSLTTVHVAKELLGSRAVEMLLWRLDHMQDPFEKRLLAGEMIYRDSIAAVGAAKA